MLKEKRAFSAEAYETSLAILTDPIGFIMHFWKSETTIPQDRIDLPAEWLGEQVITLEQRLMWCDGAVYMLMSSHAPEIARKSSQRVLARTSRKTGKTLRFEAIYIQIAICHVGERTEGLFHAPSDVHLQQVLARADNKTDTTPLFKVMHTRRSNEVNIDEWATGYTWHRRIEGNSGTGRNMVGLRAKHVIGDEGDYAQEAAHSERQQTALPSAFWFWGGVPRPGAQTVFRKIARNDNTWSSHVQRPENFRAGIFYDMRCNPLYHSQEAWKREIGANPYESDWVQTQVLGMDGGEGSSAFPTLAIASLPFKYFYITDRDVETDEQMEAFITSLGLGDTLPVEPQGWTIHCDYGHSPSPMVIGISYLYDYIWYEYARISALRMHSPAAARLLNAIDMAMPIQPIAIAMDPHGRGAGTYENLREMDIYQPWDYKTRLISADFHTRIEDNRIMVHKRCNRVVQEISEFGEPTRFWECPNCRTTVYEDEVRPMRVMAKQLLTTDLSEALARAARKLSGENKESDATGAGEHTDYGVVLARADEELISELAGTTVVTSSANGNVSYMPPLGKTVDHNTDAWRCLMSVVRHIKDVEAFSEEDLIVDEFGFI